MRTLKFIVDNQSIKQDPDCDFSGLVPGTDGYLCAEFSFSREWSKCAKVVAFYSIMGKEYPAQVLKDGHSCVIPSEALAKRAFKIRVIGKNAKYKIRTDKITIIQNGGGE